MLDEVVVFSRSGLVLFRREFIQVKDDPVGSLIRTVLLENREVTASSLVVGQHSVKYLLVNKLDLVFAAVYPSLLQPPYVDDALQDISKGFCKQFSEEEIRNATGKLDFDARFDKLLWEAEEAWKRPGKREASGPKTGEPQEEKPDFREESPDSASPVVTGKRVQGVPRAYQGKKKATAASDAGDARSALSPSSRNKKEKRNWDGRATEEQAAALDMSEKRATQEEAIEAYAERSQKYMPAEADAKADIDMDSESDSDSDEESGWSFSKTKVGTFFAGLTGQKPLTREDLEQALDQLDKQLQSKNVSSDAAKEIVEAVAKELVGKKLGSMTRGVGTAVRETCHGALERLLTPKRSIDILRDVRAAKAEGRPYTIVFIGVNGVGKSTSLSKVCYYLKSNGSKVLLCACDTFRSGAVEQLKVHSRNLNVELFEQGYNKDAASVATNGIKHAKEEGFDVVLIDTAGRMQNNEPLMRQLTRLVASNRPDLILFVGEALAGNDGRDQLLLFDKALVDYSNSPDPRRIDGMMLTKFDTIDDKVGAAVSMVHSSGQPIIFVGTGQKYTNLNRLNVSKIVKSLLSDF